MLGKQHRVLVVESPSDYCGRRLPKTHQSFTSSHHPPKMPSDPIVDDEDYASSEDSDFAPEDAPEQDGGAESSDEDDSEAVPAAKSAAPSKKRTQAGDGDEAADAGFENSGDEAIIEKGKKRQKKTRKAQQNLDDEGGEGGLIKTRSMRAVECVLPALFIFRGHWYLWETCTDLQSVIQESRAQSSARRRPRHNRRRCLVGLHDRRARHSHATDGPYIRDPTRPKQQG